MKLHYIIAALILIKSAAAATAEAQKPAADCSNPKNPAVIVLIKQEIDFEAQNDLERAMATSKKILALEPRNECALNTIAGLYGVAGSYDREIVWAKRALAVNPKFAEAYINLGNAQVSLARLKEARASFNKARALAPDNPLPVYSLGVFAEQQRNFEEARGFYQKSIEIDPQFEDGYFNLAAMDANLKRFAEAKATLQKLLALHPNRQDAQEMLRRIEQEKQ